MAANDIQCMEISIADEGRLLTLKTILGYEAGARGLTLGQALAQMLREAVNVDSYPEELRQLLADIDEGRRRRAVERSLVAAGLAKSA